MIDQDLHFEILGRTLGRGGEYADVFVESRSVTSLILEDSRLEKIITGNETGAGIRLLYSGKTSYAFSNDLSARALLLAAAEASRMAADGSPREVRRLTARPPSVEWTARLY